MNVVPELNHERQRPWGLKWRSSVWFVTTTVTLGITTDLLVYSMVIPVFPFQLEKLGYSGVSGLVGWLLFAYSGGLVASTPPTAILSERYINRQHPLLAGQLFLIGSQILLMEAPKYWVMALARVIQGISSSVIWVVGLALLCDTAPESIVGTQLGIAMSGVTLGFLIGPPVGGALFNTFGYRGPFIFGIIVTFVDFIGRLLIVERKDALLHDLDNWAQYNKTTDAEGQAGEPEKDAIPVLNPVTTGSSTTEHAPEKELNIVQTDVQAPLEAAKAENLPRRLTIIGVLRVLVSSPRALAALLNTMLYGILYTAQEPSLPLHLQDVWGLSSARIGVIYLASVVPSLFSGPLAGWCADRWGAEWIAVSCILLAVPWMAVMIVEKTLALFIVAFAFQSFFISGVISPITADLAAVSRTYEGLGYAHVYGAFNFFYGIGSALGPIIGGQMYDHIKRGWMAICLLGAGLACVCAALSACFTGGRPLVGRLITRHRTRRADADGTTTN